MKRSLEAEPPPTLVAYELPTGEVLFVHELPKIPEIALLTAAEQEVLTLLCSDRTTAAIAKLRNTSPRTISNQVANIFKKLGVRSRAELAAKVFASE